MPIQVARRDTVVTVPLRFLYLLAKLIITIVVPQLRVSKHTGNPSTIATTHGENNGQQH